MTDTTFADEVASTGAAETSSFQIPSNLKPLDLPALLVHGTQVIFIIVQVLSCFIILRSHDLIKRAMAGEFSTEEAYFQEAGFIAPLADIIYPAGLGVLGLCILAYCFFVFRAASNIQKANARGLDHSPVWSVALGFIPIANLGYIYLVMKGIWIASHDPRRGIYAVPPLLPIWWSVYIVSNLVGRAADTLTQSAISEGDMVKMMNFSWLGVTSATGITLASICLMIIVQAIVRAQANWSTATAEAA